MKIKMKNEKLFEVSEIVLVPMKVVKREFDDRGNVKYQLKDQKSAKILDWFYTNKDIIPINTMNKKKKENEGNKNEKGE